MQPQETELKPPPHLSVSSIQTFNQCPLKFKYGKIDLIPDAPSEASIMGNFVHDVLEELYKLDADNRTQASARFLAKQLWDEKWGEPVSNLLKREDVIKQFRWNSWWCIENLWSLEAPENISPLGLEYEVNTQIEGVTIKGFIDRFSRSDDSLMLTVSDYKTGKTPREPYVDDKFFQLNVYAKMLSVLGVGEADRAELLYLKDGKRLSRKITDAGVASAVEVICETKENIDGCCSSGYFEPNKSVLCNWCNYKSICPAWSKK
jgi:putative RecB family exonuclease